MPFCSTVYKSVLATLNLWRPFPLGMQLAFVELQSSLEDPLKYGLYHVPLENGITVNFKVDILEIRRRSEFEKYLI
jgi:hypothetical protein